MKNELLNIDPRKLKEEVGFNVRLSGPELTEHIKRVAESIGNIGVQVPLRVVEKDGGYYVVDGHVRLEATLLAIREGVDIRTIPVIVDYGSVEDQTLSMATCNSGKPLNILEQGEVYKRLGKVWDVGIIGKKTGYSVSHISNCLLLYNAIPEIKNLVRDGKVSATLAIKLIQEQGEEKALSTLQDGIITATVAGKQKATKKDTEGKVREAKNKKFEWGKWGPKVYFALEAIVGCPAAGKGSERMGDYLAAGNEIVQKVEDAGYRRE
jgi:ParB family chromosome partitioning protein